MLKQLQISDNYFWGFNRIINIDKCNNNQDIINHMLLLLEEFLKINNLLELYNILNDTKCTFHIHNSFENILKQDYKNIIYICNHK
jgi:hypothetical protein